MSRRFARSAGLAVTVLAWLLALVPAFASAPTVTVTYVYTNPQGTPLARADANGTLLARYDYTPYGQAVGGPLPAGPGYTGHVNDPDTGLVYMQQRYYDPEVGRFISPDPVAPTPGNIFNFGRYTYANNNPIVNVDPDGRSALLALAGVLYETGSWVSGNGFHGSRIAGALVDGYNGEGAGVKGALAQDAGIVLTVATLGTAGPEVAGTEVAGAEVTAEVAGEGAAEAAVGDAGKEIGILRDAAKGKGNFGLGTGTREESAKLGEAWVGNDAKLASDGKTLISKDGMRQYRPPSTKPNLGKVQANFEQRLPGQKTNQWQSNGHLDITD